MTKEKAIELAKEFGLEAEVLIIRSFRIDERLPSVATLA